MGMEQLNNTKNHNWVFYFLGYVALWILSNYLHNKFPNKLIKYINYCISFPLSFVLLLFQFAVPTMGIIIHTTLFIALSFSIPLFLTRLNDYFNYLNLTDQTTIFINLTFATCSSVAFYKLILDIVYRFGPFRIKSSEKIKKFKLDALTEYVLNKENIRFIIYSSFFIYLLMFSFQYLQNSSIFEIGEKDRAVYQSFLCFLAFDRLLLNSKRFILMPSELLKKMLVSIIGDEEEKNFR
ncbi:MAG: hypothetical protein CMC96_01790 [Flavobacteriales bacterium]|nr:hypothetical protein [Flavobacteriales bacterium]